MMADELHTNQPSIDGFYRAFEDRFRGSRDLIKSRLLGYRPFLDAVRGIGGHHVAVDLGCGRGEWLEVLQELGFDAQGVDLDEAMLAACHERGLTVTRGDAIRFLQGLADDSQLIISGFHIAEHLPFPVLHTLMQEALRVLIPGGLLILETPNAESIRVGTYSFHLDPTHERPLPYELLSFLPEYHGFARVKVVGLQEPPELRQSEAILLGHVLTGVSPDYAVVAQKGADPDVMAATEEPFKAEYGVTLGSLIGRFDKRLATYEPRLNQVDDHLGGVDHHLGGVDHHLDEIDHQIGAFTRRIDALGEQGHWFNQRISDLEARLQSALGDQQRLRQQLADLNSTSGRLQRFKRGVIAWAALKPGSRPRRTARAAAVGLIAQIQKHPRLANFAKQAVGRFPSVSNRLRVMMHPPGPNAGIPADEPEDDSPVDLSMETQSVRLAFTRLMEARANLQPGPACAGPELQAEASGSLDGGCQRDLPKLAYLSPLPPERSGVADYSAELLPELARYYRIDVIVTQSEVSDPWVKKHCTVRDADWFARHAHGYDRIVYHIGNSIFHLHMLSLVEKYPGVVILHDFYLSGLIAHMELEAGRRAAWSRELYHSHGFGAVRDRYAPARQLQTIHDYPANLSVLQQAQGVIVHSRFSQSLAEKFYRERFGDDWNVVPLARLVPNDLDRDGARRCLGLKDDEFLVCSFGLLGETKLNHRLLEAWLRGPLAKDPRCHLVFVGQDIEDEYCQQLRRRISASPAGKRIRITGFASPDIYRQYLQAADVAVQLRTLSRGETSAAALDCLAFGLPTIVNANGSMAALPPEGVIMLDDNFLTRDLADAITSLRDDPVRRRQLGLQGRSLIESEHSPSRVAEQYASAIEKFARNAASSQDVRALAAQAASLTHAPADDSAWLETARTLARRSPLRAGARQLLVDVSVLAQDDYKTGIQRVVRAQLLTLLNAPPPGFRVEPVRLCHTNGLWHYRYARRYMLELLNLPRTLLRDDPIEFASGDLFYMPDYWTDGVVHATQAGIYNEMRRRGVQTSFVVYDMLPVLKPEFFPDFARQTHAGWLSSLASCADRLICISASVADELRDWLASNHPEALQRLKITSLHLGADIDASAPSKGLPKDASTILAALASRPSWLMVGTIEPRKGHLQTLSAFESLWDKGLDANLVIVGGEGWKALPDEQRRAIPEIVARLRNHPERGTRLFWLEGVSDEYLEKIYATCVGLIAASEGEGFGLPLIEAARHRIPILARDIPVFREVAGPHASYFAGSDPAAIADAIEAWLAARANNAHPKSDQMPWLTWADNVEHLKVILLGPSTHEPDQKSTMRPSDPAATG